MKRIKYGFLIGAGALALGAVPAFAQDDREERQEERQERQERREAREWEEADICFEDGYDLGYEEGYADALSVDDRDRDRDRDRDGRDRDEGPSRPTRGDSDDDGIADQDDLCPETNLPEEPVFQLGQNRWADVDGDGVFESGGRAMDAFTMEDTGGCSCHQIVGALSLGRGHEQYGCSEGAMMRWIDRIEGR